MSVNYYFPVALSKSRLDRYLAGGWFRHNTFMFRSKAICLDGGLHTPVNIRMNLSEYSPSKSLRKIKNTNDKIFSVVVRKAYIDAQKERLYYLQKNKFKGFIYESLAEFFYPGLQHGHFDTHEIAVYLGSKLVAVSFFDRGLQSAASLLALYDEDFSQYSLGFYTMLIEIETALADDMKYYYPGYIVHGNPCFDYKLRPGAIHYFDWKGRWKPWRHIEKEEFYSELLNKKIDSLELQLKSEGVECKKLLYPYFSFGYVNHYNEPFVKSPIFLLLGKHLPGNRTLIAEYFPDEDLFTCRRVSECKFQQMIMELRAHSEYENTEVYCNKLIVYEGPTININDVKHLTEICAL